VRDTRKSNKEYERGESPFARARARAAANTRVKMVNSAENNRAAFSAARNFLNARIFFASRQIVDFISRKEGKERHVDLSALAPIIDSERGRVFPRRNQFARRVSGIQRAAAANNETHSPTAFIPLADAPRDPL